MKPASNTSQTSLFFEEPELTSVTSTIIAVRPHHSGLAVAISENIARASGGGEPRDIGTIAGYMIHDVEKYEGKTWIAFASTPDTFHIGDQVLVTLDAAHRARRRQLHTAVHLLLRSTCEEIESVKVVAADIADDASVARILLDPPFALEGSTIAAIDCRMRSAVLRASPITAQKLKSLEEARNAYGSLFRFSDRHALSGKIRIVVVEGFDANPCGGLHHETSNIGPYTLDAFSNDLSGSSRVSLEIRLQPAWMYWYPEGYLKRNREDC